MDELLGDEDVDMVEVMDDTDSDDAADVFDSGDEEDPNRNVIFDSEDDFEDLLSNASDEDDQGHHFNFIDEAFTLDIEAAGLNEPLTATGNMLKVEKLILELAKNLQLKESYKSMILSMKMANIEFDDTDFPESMTRFWKVVNRRVRSFRSTLICCVCGDELGNNKTPDVDCTCGECGPQKKNEMLGTTLYLDLPSQLQSLFSRPGMATALEYPYTRTKRNPEAIEDVYDGTVYTTLSQEGFFLHRDNHNYSLALWTDGVDPVVSAKVGIWPVFVQVLELSPRARQRNTLLAAIYVGPAKPEMSTFLQPVSQTLRDLHNEGISWIPHGAVERVVSRFMVLIVSADSEARCLIFGMLRHNGYFGCTYCYAEGERSAENNRVHIYPYDNNTPDRTDADIRRDAVIALENERPENGVKEISALSIVPRLNLRTSQLVESLHCLWEGNFARHFTILTNAETEDHIFPRNLAIVNQRMKTIKTPTKLRATRDLSGFANFKATEHRNMAWFYWLPCAQDFISEERRNHFSLFAEATFLLNKDCILPEELDRAEGLLDQYYAEFAGLYSERHLVYNVHLLKHASRSVRELGPLWVASGFWFESMNRQVKNFLTSPNARAWQVASRILLTQMIEKCLDWELSPAVQNLLREIMGKAKWVAAPEFATGRYFRNEGLNVPSTFNPREIMALETAGINIGGIDIIRHSRVTIDGVVYQVPSQRSVVHDNSVAHVNARHHQIAVNFVRIQTFFTWRNREEEVRGIFGIPFNTVDRAFNTTYMEEVTETEDLLFTPLSSILAQAVLVRSCGRIYVSPLPNRWDID